MIFDIDIRSISFAIVNGGLKIEKSQHPPVKNVTFFYQYTLRKCIFDSLIELDAFSIVPIKMAFSKKTYTVPHVSL